MSTGTRYYTPLCPMGPFSMHTHIHTQSHSHTHTCCRTASMSSWHSSLLKWACKCPLTLSLAYCISQESKAINHDDQPCFHTAVQTIQSSLNPMNLVAPHVVPCMVQSTRGHCIILCPCCSSKSLAQLDNPISLLHLSLHTVDQDHKHARQNTNYQCILPLAPRCYSLQAPACAFAQTLHECR